MVVKLTTPRLTLRQPGPEDVDAIVEGLNDFEVTRFLTRVPFPYGAEDAHWWFGTLTTPRPGRAHFAIDLSGQLIGVVGIETELGYWLDRRHHGRGFMTEAAEALLQWHFAALPDSTVASGAHVGNAASLHVQNKLGFRDTGRRSMRMVSSLGREVEHVETSLTRADFETVRQALGRQ
jgi:RimJ/RimL family protein N-acetyltransferase